MDLAKRILFYGIMSLLFIAAVHLVDKKMGWKF
jgi:hypothetical protein